MEASFQLHWVGHAAWVAGQVLKLADTEERPKTYAAQEIEGADMQVVRVFEAVVSLQLGTLQADDCGDVAKGHRPACVETV